MKWPTSVLYLVSLIQCAIITDCCWPTHVSKWSFHQYNFNGEWCNVNVTIGLYALPRTSHCLDLYILTFLHSADLQSRPSYRDEIDSRPTNLPFFKDGELQNWNYNYVIFKNLLHKKASWNLFFWCDQCAVVVVVVRESDHWQQLTS